LAYSSVGTAGQVLVSGGSGSPTWSSAGTGSVTSVAVSGGATGLTTSGGPVTTSGTITIAGTLATANGGTGGTATPTAGTIPYGTGTALAYSAAGTSGQVLMSGGAGTPTWTTVTGTGTVTSVNVSGGATGLTYSGGPITGSGTITMAGTLAVANGGTGVTTSTGSGNTVLSASPTFSGTISFPGSTTIDTSGNVGIGTTSPGALLHVSNSVAVIRIGLTASSAYTDIYRDSFTGFTIYNAAQATPYRAHIWQLGGTEAMRIDPSGNVGIGTSSPNASAILDAQSTTKGVRFPNMTTTQKNAVSSPAAGLVVFDTTLAKLCVYSGSAWQTITSI